MSLSFSQYHIATSHNSYLQGQQLFTCTSKTSARKILQDGARMIELDIFWEPSIKKVLVSHGRNMSPKFNLFCSVPLTLDMLCEQISEFITPDTSPIIIMLEVDLGSSLEGQNMSADVLREILGEYLVSGDIDLRMAFPEHYYGKILLGAGGGLNRSSELYGMINVKFAQENYLMNRSHNSIIGDQIYYGGLLISGNVIRSYPSNIYISKNFNPSPLFGLGVQFISMNYQTNDEYMKEYRKRFEGLPMVGYLPKKQLL
jgi:hypothetical protein